MTANARTITVTGEGRVLAAPDTGQAELGVVSRDAGIAPAQQEADRSMQAVIAALREQGLATEQIRTVAYGITEERDRSRPDLPLMGYAVRHLVRVTVRPPDQIGPLVAAALAAGANMVQTVSLVLADRGAALSQARELAVEDAHGRAEQLARLAGVSLGPPLTIAEGGAAAPGMWRTRSFASLASIDSSAGPPIEAGQLDVSVTLTITYAMS